MLEYGVGDYHDVHDYTGDSYHLTLHHCVVSVFIHIDFSSESFTYNNEIQGLHRIPVNKINSTWFTHSSPSNTCLIVNVVAGATPQTLRGNY